MALYHLHDTLYRLVEKVNATEAMLEKTGAGLKEPAAHALVKDYAACLQQLRETLPASRQKSIFADEVRLRERITEVYSAVALQEARPSNCNYNGYPSCKKR